jgi:hypothetical protein
MGKTTPQARLRMLFILIVAPFSDHCAGFHHVVIRSHEYPNFGY